MSSGEDVSSKVSNLIELLDSFQPNILCDHSEQLWAFLCELRQSQNSDKRPRRRVDIILDNCSIELAADLALCDFLLRNNFVDEVRLHGKAYSWFVSDVTSSDLDTFLRQMQSAHGLLTPNNLHRRLLAYSTNGRLIVDFANFFWTSPHAFKDMERVVPDFYADLRANSALLVFKGDLNYRKLLGDLDWPFDTPLLTSFDGFAPTSVCAIRTIKADLIANLDLDEANNKAYGRVKKKFGENKVWMTTGDYGLVQLATVSPQNSV